MISRIRKLEATVEEMDGKVAALSAERSQLTSQFALVNEELAAEAERRNLTEALNKEHEAYSQGLAGDLAAAYADIERLTAVIANAFGSIEAVIV